MCTISVRIFCVSAALSNFCNMVSGSLLNVVTPFINYLAILTGTVLSVVINLRYSRGVIPETRSNSLIK